MLLPCGPLHWAGLEGGQGQGGLGDPDVLHGHLDKGGREAGPQ